MVDDYQSEPMESKRYSVDHSDTTFGVMTSPYIASKSYGFRSGAAYSGGICRPAASPSAFQEGNRSGKWNQGYHGIDAVKIPKHVFRYLHKHMHWAQTVIRLHVHVQTVLYSYYNECNRSICLSPFVFLGHLPAYSPSPETSESKPPPSKDPSRWSVEEVAWFIKDADPQALGPHVELFRKHVSVGCSFITAW